MNINGTDISQLDPISQNKAKYDYLISKLNKLRDYYNSEDSEYFTPEDIALLQNKEKRYVDAINALGKTMRQQSNIAEKVNLQLESLEHKYKADEIEDFAKQDWLPRTTEMGMNYLLRRTVGGATKIPGYLAQGAGFIGRWLSDDTSPTAKSIAQFGRDWNGAIDWGINTATGVNPEWFIEGDEGVRLSNSKTWTEENLKNSLQNAPNATYNAITGLADLESTMEGAGYIGGKLGMPAVMSAVNPKLRPAIEGLGFAALNIPEHSDMIEQRTGEFRPKSAIVSGTASGLLMSYAFAMGKGGLNMTDAQAMKYAQECAKRGRFGLTKDAAETALKTMVYNAPMTGTLGTGIKELVSLPSNYNSLSTEEKNEVLRNAMDNIVDATGHELITGGVFGLKSGIEKNMQGVARYNEMVQKGRELIDPNARKAVKTDKGIKYKLKNFRSELSSEIKDIGNTFKEFFKPTVEVDDNAFNRGVAHYFLNTEGSKRLLSEEAYNKLVEGPESNIDNFIHSLESSIPAEYRKDPAVFDEALNAYKDSLIFTRNIAVIQRYAKEKGMDEEKLLNRYGKKEIDVDSSGKLVDRKKVVKAMVNKLELLKQRKIELEKQKAEIDKKIQDKDTPLPEKQELAQQAEEVKTQSDEINFSQPMTSNDVVDVINNIIENKFGNNYYFRSVAENLLGEVVNKYGAEYSIETFAGIVDEIENRLSTISRNQTGKEMMDWLINRETDNAVPQSVIGENIQPIKQNKIDSTDKIGNKAVRDSESFDTRADMPQSVMTDRTESPAIKNERGRMGLDVEMKQKEAVASKENPLQNETTFELFDLLDNSKVNYKTKTKIKRELKRRNKIAVEKDLNEIKTVEEADRLLRDFLKTRDMFGGQQSRASDLHKRLLELERLNEESAKKPNAEKLDLTTKRDALIPKQNKKSATEKSSAVENIVRGKKTKMTTKANGGMEVDGEFAVVDVNDLETSTSIGETQNRNRNTIASQAQINSIANNPNPDYLLVDNADSANGAMVVMWNPKTKKYRVLSGNGRTLGLTEAYKYGKADNYQKELNDKASSFDIDKESIGKIKNPVLVRIVNPKDGFDVKRFVKESNESQQLGRNASEIARTDAENIKGILRDFNSVEDIASSSNKEFIQKFFDKTVGNTERAMYLAEDGSLTPDGRRRVENALIASLYGDNPRLIEKLTNTTNEGIKNIANALISTARDGAKLKGEIDKGSFFDIDFTKEIGDAALAYADTIAEMKRQGVKPLDSKGNGTSPLNFYLKNMKDRLTPESKLIFGMLSEMHKSPKQTREFLQIINDVIRAHGDPQQGDLFTGKNPKPSKSQVIKEVLQEFDSRYKTDFSKRDLSEWNKSDRTLFGSRAKNKVTNPVSDKDLNNFLKGQAKQITKETGLNFKVVDSVDELSKIAGEQLDAKTEGGIQGDTVYIVRGNVDKERFPLLIAHEVAGHRGVEALFDSKEQMDSFFKSLERASDRDRFISDAFAEVDRLGYTKNRSREAMAKIVERVKAESGTFKGTAKTFVNFITSRVRRLLRRMGFKNLQLNEAEVYDIAVQALRRTGLKNSNKFFGLDRFLAKDNEFYAKRVEDNKLLDTLNKGKKVKVYRTMQMIKGPDGKVRLYPPMSAYNGDNKSLVEPIEKGVWYQSDERPEQITKFNDKGVGYITINKTENSDLKDVAYNPYWHTSLSVLNDQFSEAWHRPELVVVEGEIPESELTSGYKAQYAKDAVGPTTQWNNGPVSNKLKKMGDPRVVILSRWNKINRIVPDSEVAQMIADKVKPKGISIPENTVTPSLKKELIKLGVEISKPERLKAETIEKHYKNLNKDGIYVDPKTKKRAIWEDGEPEFNKGEFLASRPRTREEARSPKEFFGEKRWNAIKSYKKNKGVVDNLLPVIDEEMYEGYEKLPDGIQAMQNITNNGELLADLDHALKYHYKSDIIDTLNHIKERVAQTYDEKFANKIAKRCDRIIRMTEKGEYDASKIKPISLKELEKQKIKEMPKTDWDLDREYYKENDLIDPITQTGHGWVQRGDGSYDWLSSIGEKSPIEDVAGKASDEMNTYPRKRNAKEAKKVLDKIFDYYEKLKKGIFKNKKLTDYTASALKVSFLTGYDTKEKETMERFRAIGDFNKTRDAVREYIDKTIPSDKRAKLLDSLMKQKTTEGIMDIAGKASIEKERAIRNSELEILKQNLKDLKANKISTEHSMLKLDALSETLTQEELDGLLNTNDFSTGAVRKMYKLLKTARKSIEMMESDEAGNLKVPDKIKALASELDSQFNESLNPEGNAPVPPSMKVSVETLAKLNHILKDIKDQSRIAKVNLAKDATNEAYMAKEKIVGEMKPVNEAVANSRETNRAGLYKTHFKPISAMNTLDLDNFTSEMGETMNKVAYKDMLAGQKRKVHYLAKGYRIVDDIIESFGKDKEDGIDNLNKTFTTVETADKHKYDITRDEAMAIYAMSTDRETRKIIKANGGLTLYLGDKKGSDSFTLSTEKLNEIAKSLTAKEKEAVMRVKKSLAQDYLPELNAVHERLNGVPLRLLVDETYFPRTYMEDADVSKGNGVLDGLSAPYVSDAANADWVSIIKHRNDGGKFRLKGLTKTYENYVDQASNYIGIAEPLKKLNRILDKGMEKEITQRYGWEYFDRLQRMTQLNAGMAGKTREDKQVLSRYLSNIAAAKLTPVSALKQFSSVPLASSVIPFKYLVKAMVSGLSKENIAEMMKLDDMVLRYRDNALGGIMPLNATNMEAERSLGTFRGKNPFTKAVKWGLNLSLEADKRALGIIYKATKLMAEAQGKGNDSAWIENKFMDAVRRTQNTTDLASATGWQELSRKSSHWAFLNMYLNQTQKLPNEYIRLKRMIAQAEKAYGKDSAQYKEAKGNMVNFMIGMGLMNAMSIGLGMTTGALLNKDDDKKTGKETMAEIATESLFNFTGNPIIKPALGGSGYVLQKALPKSLGGKRQRTTTEAFGNDFSGLLPDATYTTSKIFEELDSNDPAMEKLRKVTKEALGSKSVESALAMGRVPTWYGRYIYKLFNKFGSSSKKSSSKTTSRAFVQRSTRKKR